MNKKRLLIVALGIIAAILAMFLILSLSLSDSDVNGLTGTLGIFKLSFSNETGVKITNDPLQYMIRSGSSGKNSLELFLMDITDGNYGIDSFYTGTAVIEEIPYKYRCRSFTNMYWIVTFEPDEN